MKHKLLILLLPIIKKLMTIFFNKNYLSGRWFDDSTIGWKWCIKGIWIQKILGFNRNVPFPINPTTIVSNCNRIHFHPDNIDNFQSPGCYFQCFVANIYIEHGTYIAPNVGIITANHNIYDLDETLEGKDIIIGKNCWIGMNSVILPGVILGDRTIVGAGSIVSKSFEEGNCVIGGVPAKLIKKL